MRSTSSSMWNSLLCVNWRARMLGDPDSLAVRRRKELPRNHRIDQRQQRPEQLIDVQRDRLVGVRERNGADVCF
jgi:hypothetical protein